jgi:hypothetical protein
MFYLEKPDSWCVFIGDKVESLLTLGPFGQLGRLFLGTYFVYHSIFGMPFRPRTEAVIHRVVFWV